MARHKVEICGVNTANLKVLSNEEMIELFKKMYNGDAFAREDLINGNLKLVLSILKKYNNGKNNLNDLFQVGVVGLIKAIDNFDLSYNLMFSTYAVTLIMGEIRRYIRDNTAYRVSRSIKELSYAILSFKEKFQNEYGYEPNQTDIANALGINEYEVSYALESLTPTISIYEPVYQDDGEAIYLHDQLPDKKENNDFRDSYILLNESIEKLKQREKDILVKRYIVGKTQMELAKEYNISQAQVSRIEKSAIRSLKKMML